MELRKIFSMAVSTLNFDHDLSNVNNDVSLFGAAAQMLNIRVKFLVTELVVFKKSQQT